MDKVVSGYDDCYVIGSGQVVSHVKMITKTENTYACSYTIESNAQLFYVVVCRDQAPTHINLLFILEPNAIVRVELLIAHVSTSVSINCVMRGESSYAIINGAYILRGTDNVTITTQQNHLVAHTTSNLMMKGVLKDSSHITYVGMISAAKEASFTVASQENKNIVLSDNARALSIPQLEVLTNDVQCFHGSAIGRFDQEQLFYCAARGIEGKNAERLLLQAFFLDMFESNQLKMFLEELL